MNKSARNWIITILIVTATFIVGLHFGAENPFPPKTHLGSMTTPNTVIYKICWTDNLKAEGKIDDLPEVQTGALCAYDVKQAWKLFK